MPFYVAIFLSVVFAISGVMKFVDSKAFKKTILEIGVPNSFVPFIVRCVPMAELIASILLVLEPVKKAGELITFFLLIVFFIVTLRMVVMNRKTSCNCFGQLLPEQFGKSTLARIVFLFMLTIFLLYSSGTINYSSISPEVIFDAVFSSLGIFTIYILLTAVYTYIYKN